MRVIAGQAHGRRLKAPQGLRTRPATARARASIFSRLEAGSALEGLRVLDIFAGSGSLGIEALSRGAQSATFVDSSRAAADAIRDNLARLGLSPRGRVITADFRRVLAALEARRAQFDLVFVDPPYRDDTSAEVLAKLAATGLVARGGRVVIRQSRRLSTPAPASAGFEQLKVATIGDHRIAFYRRLEGEGAGKADTPGTDD
jgi:16S rRNA (guanine966-N2)-methyltransferase